MSAYVLHPSHVGLLAAAVAIKVYDLKEEYFAQRLAEHMMTENINSVLYRCKHIGEDVKFYKENKRRLVDRAKQYAAYYIANFPDWINDCDIYNMAGCLDYQSCEHPEWEQSTAYSIVQKTLWQYDHAKNREAMVEWEYIDKENIFGDYK